MIGLVAGTGLGEAFFRGAYVEERTIETPFGRPSSAVRIVEVDGTRVAILARHGDGHTIPPSSVPYRANIFALKSLGVTHLVTSGAVGSLREEIAPRDLVLVDQLIDRTYRRVPTFFDEGLAVHAELAHPYCPSLRTRLKKLADGVAEATLLAAAGLNRLGMADRIAEIINDDVLLPAAGQGAIGIEIRSADTLTAERLATLDHQSTHIAIVAERAFLGTLDGSCRTPIAALATLASGKLSFRGEVISPDGRQHVSVTRVVPPQEAARMGADAGAEILSRAGSDLFGVRG